MQGVDKIFTPVCGRPLLAWSVSVFEASPVIDEIVVAVHRSAIQQGRALAQQEHWGKVSQVCRGGPRRQDSVREALWRLGKCDWVLVHDGARPCVEPQTILDGLDAAQETGAAVPGLPVHETVKRAGPGGLITATVEREGLWLVQTPQVFSYAILWAAYQRAGEDPSLRQAQGELGSGQGATDDAALVERQGVAVKVFPGSARNIKVTVPADLERAAQYLECG